MSFNVKWDAFVRAFIDNDGYKKVLTGLQNTLIIAVVGLLIGIVIGTIIAAVEVMPKYKRLPRILDKICRVYVAFFRGTSSPSECAAGTFTSSAEISLSAALSANSFPQSLHS